MDLPRLYTLREVAVLLRVPLATVRYWVNTGRIESVRPAKHRLIEEPTLRQFVRSRKKESTT